MLTTGCISIQPRQPLDFTCILGRGPGRLGSRRPLGWRYGCGPCRRWLLRLPGWFAGGLHVTRRSHVVSCSSTLLRLLYL